MAKEKEAPTSESTQLPTSEVSEEPEKEASTPTSEVQETVKKEISTPTSEVGKITLDEHLKQEKVHTGLVASFRVEIAANEVLGLPKTAEDWKLALEAQSNKIYA